MTYEVTAFRSESESHNNQTSSVSNDHEGGSSDQGINLSEASFSNEATAR